MHPSQLMRDSQGRAQGLSTSLSLEVIELNILQILPLQLLLTLLCCREGLLDYHTIRKHVEKKGMGFKSMKFFLHAARQPLRCATMHWICLALSFTESICGKSLEIQTSRQCFAFLLRYHKTSSFQLAHSEQLRCKVSLVLHLFCVSSLKL